MFLCSGPAFIVDPGRRIGADSREAFAGLQALVSGSRWNNQGVTGFEFQRAASVSAKSHSRAAARDSKDFMDAGMIVEIIVYFTSPAFAPLIAFEDYFPDGCRVNRAGQPDGAMVEHERPKRVIGDEPIVLETESHWSARLNEAGKLLG